MARFIEVRGIAFNADLIITTIAHHEVPKILLDEGSWPRYKQVWSKGRDPFLEIVVSSGELMHLPCESNEELEVLDEEFNYELLCLR